MSRSGYTEDGENYELYRATVKRAIKGKRGQAFLKELAAAMDAMPVKELIDEELVSEKGCCAIGVVCKARGLNTENVDIYDAAAIGKLVNISKSMAAEIEYYNDEYYEFPEEDPASRWQRMRNWVEKRIIREELVDATET